MNDWRKIAALRWLGASVHGTGRYAVVACNQKAVWLCNDERAALAASLGSCHQLPLCQANHGVFDLQPCPLPRKERADDHEDREWLKRQA